MLLAIILIPSVPTILPAIVVLLLSDVVRGLLILSTLLVSVVFVELMRRGVSVRILGTLHSAMVLLVLTVSAHGYGGLSSPPVVVMLLAPVIAVFMVGIRTGLVSASLVLANYAVLYLPIPDASRDDAQALSVLCVCLFVLTIAAVAFEGERASWRRPRCCGPRPRRCGPRPRLRAGRRASSSPT